MMTNSQTTEQTAMERFRAALGKRGIEFETNDDECAEGEERMTVFKANLGEGEFDIFVTAKDWYFDGKLTPWLDVEFHNALTPEQAIATTVGNGTLTAEQVREAIERHSAWVIGNNRCFHDGAYEEIADELNAELGSGTCELAYGEDDEGYDGWYCQSCGGWFDAVRRDGKLVEPMRCGCCGRKVKR